MSITNSYYASQQTAENSLPTLNKQSGKKKKKVECKKKDKIRTLGKRFASSNLMTSKIPAVFLFMLSNDEPIIVTLCC